MSDLLETKSMALEQCDRLCTQFKNRVAQAEVECSKYKAMLQQVEREVQEYQASCNLGNFSNVLIKSEHALQFKAQIVF